MRVSIFIALLAALGGCSGDGSGPECLTNADCEGAAICLDGECRILDCLPDCVGKCGGAEDGCGGTCNEPCDAEHWCNGQVCEACGTGGHCGFCLACDGQGNCVAVPGGEDPFEDCAGEPPCGQACDGAGGCVFPGHDVGCGLICQHCDGAGNCLANCDHDECRQNLWECQCHPLPTELTCGSTAGGDLGNVDDTTGLFDNYGQGCNWPGNPLDGREATYSFGFSGTPSPRRVAVTVYAVCGVSEIVGIALAGEHPCDLDQCVPDQAVSDFV